MVSNSIVINLLALIWPIVGALRERHYVMRSSAIFNGLSLIGAGLGILIFSPGVNISGIPLLIIPIIWGMLGVALTSIRNDLGTLICSSFWTSVGLGVILIIQIATLGFSTI